MKNLNLKILYKLFLKHNLICIVIVLTIFLLDRISKFKIIENLKINDEIFVNNYLNLELVWNTGIGFGLLSGNADFLYHTISLVIFLLIILLIYLINKSMLVEKILFATILGGAIGNFYDRIMFFAVPDFIDLHYENIHWFTFNIADIFISFGIIGLIFLELIKDKKNVKI